MRIKDVEGKTIEKICTKRGVQQKTEKLKNMLVSRRNDFYLVAFFPLAIKFLGLFYT